LEKNKGLERGERGDEHVAIHTYEEPSFKRKQPFAALSEPALLLPVVEAEQPPTGGSLRLHHRAG
jgi:hypothetical protein